MNEHCLELRELADRLSMIRHDLESMGFTFEQTEYGYSFNVNGYTYKTRTESAAVMAAAHFVILNGLAKKKHHHLSTTFPKKE